MTALVLRYEHSISEPALALPASDEEIAPLTQVEGGSSTASFSIKEAVAARVPIPHDRPQFSKPLFYVLLAGLFIVHVPGIILSVLLANEWALLDSSLHPILNAVAKLIVSFPNQIWTIALHPFLVGVACLVRKDGVALWRYHEVIAKPLAPAPAPTEENEPKVPTQMEEQAESKLVDSDGFFTKEIPYDM